MKKKTCSKCNIKKHLSKFNKEKNTKTGYYCQCKICVKEVRIKRKDKIQIYLDKNKERNNARQRKYNKENRAIANKYYREKRRNNNFFRLICNLRRRINHVIVKKTLSKSTSKLLGANYKTVYNHIESLFTEGMCWDKVGIEIHIDHKIPLVSANSKKELIKLFHYKNLQPLWAFDNFSKGSKY